MEASEFRDAVYAYYEKEGRDFPWRKNTRPWAVLVSEFMLQQTQTERALPYWERWMELWPEPEGLAAAPFEAVLREWSGLGYNRRARYIHACAKIIAEEHRGKVPGTPAELRRLPGIGGYCSGAIACFGYNYPAVFIETNIRAAVIHFFFQDRVTVDDRDIRPILEDTLDRENPRKWYYALMDYGAALKKITANPGRKSAHYAKQSRFQGSFRQKRGRLVKALAFGGPASAKTLARSTGMGEGEICEALASLEKDLLVAEKGGVYRIR
ncbi:MAG: A/G-specific adenine glycosylase [Treponema sp.]|jgi:A/G-specific adenine glycosylase|nr:A/G-specific adenine glycosylase [Treponema sp.]